MTPEERRARNRAKYAANPEKYRAKALRYVRKHQKERAEYSRAYRAANLDKVKASKAARYKANPGLGAAEQRAYKLRHPDRAKASATRQNLRRYGLTVESRAVLLGKQEGLCAICANILKPGRGTHVDHSHKTHAVRGLLCSACNLILGHAKDDPAILEAAVTYLRNAAVVTDTSSSLALRRKHRAVA